MSSSSTRKMPKVVIEVVRREIIKPLTPTPDHLKKFDLSVYGQIIPPNLYMPLVFFYPNSEKMCVVDRNQRLKESLSETLVRFYPMAGKINIEGVYVECDDSGAEFVETKVNGCSLADILKCPNNEILCKLLPCDRSTSGPGPLVRVRSHVFECGGMAVGTCFSHLIMDASSRNAFLKEWAAAARGEAVKQPPPPGLDAISSRFPKIPNMGFLDYQSAITPNKAMRRFVFDSNKITSLKNVKTVSGVRPTRVEAVTALIFKCMVNSFTLTMQSGHETRPSLASQVTNLRRRVDPPISETSLGNMVWFIFAESGNQNEFINDPQSIIAQFRKGMRDLTHDWATSESDSTRVLEGMVEMVQSWGDMNVYHFSSSCGFGLYELLNFGWGMPVWISMAASYDNGMVRMFDAREGGGIEAWITLPEEHMTFFETNNDLLEFASLNPPICLS